MIDRVLLIIVIALLLIAIVLLVLIFKRSVNISVKEDVNSNETYISTY